MLIHPIPAGVQTARFGPRGIVPGLGDLGFHTGNDWAATPGTPLVAAVDGMVTRKWWDAFPSGVGAGGWMIETTAANGWQVRYAHMLQPSSLTIGDEVMAGHTIVGLCGATGAATGPHLHFELLIDGRYTDPLPHITTQRPLPPKRVEAATPELDGDTIMATYFEATANSTPTKPGNTGSSRIWAGERTINGAAYANVWERSEDGTIRRLFAAEWAGIQAAYKAAKRDLPVARVHGNAIEEMFIVKRAAPRR